MISSATRATATSPIRLPTTMPVHFRTFFIVPFLLSLQRSRCVKRDATSFGACTFQPKAAKTDEPDRRAEIANQTERHSDQEGQWQGCAGKEHADPVEEIKDD